MERSAQVKRTDPQVWRMWRRETMCSTESNTEPQPTCKCLFVNDLWAELRYQAALPGDRAWNLPTGGKRGEKKERKGGRNWSKRPADPHCEIWVCQIAIMFRFSIFLQRRTQLSSWSWRPGGLRRCWTWRGARRGAWTSPRTETGSPGRWDTASCGWSPGLWTPSRFTCTSVNPGRVRSRSRRTFGHLWLMSAAVIPFNALVTRRF